MDLPLLILLHPGFDDRPHRLCPVLPGRAVVHRAALQPVQLVDPAAKWDVGHKVEYVIILSSKITLIEFIPNFLRFHSGISDVQLAGTYLVCFLRVELEQGLPCEAVVDGTNLIGVGQGQALRLGVQRTAELLELLQRAGQDKIRSFKIIFSSERQPRYLQGGTEVDLAVGDVHQDGHYCLCGAGVVDHLPREENGVKPGVL